MPWVPTLRVALVAVAVLLLHAGQAWARPNVVLVMTDDQTQDSIRAMTKTRAGIGAPGTTFTNSLVTFPLCCPARATYMSGQYAHNHGVVNNVPPFGGYTRFNFANSLPVWLQQAGYRTIHVGRSLNGYGVDNPSITDVPPGWNDWVATLDPTTFDYARWQINENGQVLALPGLDRPFEHQTDYLGRRASELVEQAAPSPQPFFLSLTFTAPHSGKPRDPDDPPGLATPSPSARHRDAFARSPLPRPPSFNERDVSDKPRTIRRRSRLDRADFAAVQENYSQEMESLLDVDEAVGQLLGTLARTGELDNTLVIFTSDNGFMHGEHRIRAAKVFPYEPSIRVPLLMRGPGVPTGLRYGKQAANIDLAPTILDAADARPGRLQDGTSLLGLAVDPQKRSGREVVLENGRGLRTISRYRGLRNDRYVYIRHERTRERELYDLRRDRYQLRNLAKVKRFRRVRILMDRRLRKLSGCRGAAACGTSRPAVALKTRCVDAGLRFGVYGREAFRVARVGYLVDGLPTGGSRKRPFRVTAPPQPSRVLVRAKVTMVDGRVATYDRRVRACGQ